MAADSKPLTDLFSWINGSEHPILVLKKGCFTMCVCGGVCQITSGEFQIKKLKKI